MAPTISPANARRAKIGTGNLAKEASLKRSDRRKTAPTAPQNAPSNRNHGSWARRVKSKEGTSNQCPTPKKVLDKVEATTEETSNGAKRFIEKFPRTIWAAKTAPLIGALHPAAIPLAAPQATNKRNR